MTDPNDPITRALYASIDELAAITYGRDTGARGRLEHLRRARTAAAHAYRQIDELLDRAIDPHLPRLKHD